MQAGNGAEHPWPERHPYDRQKHAVGRSASIERCLYRTLRLAWRWQGAKAHPGAWAADEYCRPGARASGARRPHRRADMDGRRCHLGQSYGVCRVQRLCRSRGAGDRAGAWLAAAHGRSRHLPKGAGMARGRRPPSPDGRRKGAIARRSSGRLRQHRHQPRPAGHGDLRSDGSRDFCRTRHCRASACPHRRRAARPAHTRSHYRRDARLAWRVQRAFRCRDRCGEGAHDHIRRAASGGRLTPTGCDDGRVASAISALFLQLLFHQGRPEGHAGTDRIVGKIIGGVVMQRAVDRRTVAEPDIATRSLLAEEREIVACGRRRETGQHLLAKYGSGGFQCPCGRILIVDDRRNAALEAIVCGNPVHDGRTLRQTADLLFELIANLGRIGARRTTDLDGIGNDVQRIGVARLQRTGADDGRLQRIDDAADNGLQRRQESRRRRDRVLAEMRLGAMRADAAKGDAPGVRRGELRPFDHGHFVDIEAGHVVQAIDGIAGKQVEEAFLHHAPRAAAAFFGRLEDEMHRPRETTLGGEMAGGADQHGRVAIMPTGMHLAGNGGFIGTVGLLRHGQRVHVGAKTDAARAVADLQRADDAGLAEAAMHRQPGLFQQGGDDAAGALLFEAKFGMGMEVAAKRREEREILSDLLGQRHRHSFDMEHDDGVPYLHQSVACFNPNAAQTPSLVKTCAFPRTVTETMLPTSGKPTPELLMFNVSEPLASESTTVTVQTAPPNSISVTMPVHVAFALASSTEPRRNCSGRSMMSARPCRLSASTGICPRTHLADPSFRSAGNTMASPRKSAVSRSLGLR
ncbi:hypothetical protein RHSP_72357 [Rhizobium freirei PRF 81]|uniref:Uncharacterized protein n=1 Tax=Rhizobium freirei PRF 81 TaxID=363754 RepID=N6V036_9HYPH|nr:hypothetical protein RHSP_72357 [Rhizobium freirei PRF 81]